MSEQEKRDNAAQKETVSSDKKAKAPKKKDAKKPNRVLRWLKDLKGELKKVTWPSAKDVVKNVGIVIVCVLIVGACIWVFDALAHAVLEALLRLFGK
jgi:preprotein translocase subunit SecE